jgi:hypothetical protein
MVVGQFTGAVNFGGGVLTSAGGIDIFVAKYSSTGTYLWSKQIGGTGYDYVNGVAVDGASNVIIAGKFQGAVNFGGGGLTSAGGDDIFLAKYSGNGSYVWAKRFGSTSNDYANSVAIDSSNNIVMTGAFQGTVDFAGGTLTSAHLYDIFVAKYTSTGSYLWAERSGSAINQFGYDVAVNGASNIAVTGYFENIVDFGYGTHTSAGSFDAFLVTLEP